MKTCLKSNLILNLVGNSYLATTSISCPSLNIGGNVTLTFPFLKLL